MPNISFISNNTICLTHVLQSFVFLFQFCVDLHKSFLGLIKLVLNGLDLLLEGTSLFFSLYETKYFIIFRNYYSLYMTNTNT